MSRPNKPLLEGYAIFDKKTDAYANVIFLPHIVAATRGLEQTMRDPNSMISQYAEDYALYLVGYFDDKNGMLYPEIPPKHMFNLSTLKKGAPA